MNILQKVDDLRVQANAKLNPAKKSSLGQFFTPAPVSLYLASLFDNISNDVKLLDPGCGPGSLTAAFVDEALHRDQLTSLSVTAFDVDAGIQPYMSETFRLCEESLTQIERGFQAELLVEDYILTTYSVLDDLGGQRYTHVLMNPPYKKISTASEHRKCLSAAGIETVNLYSGFVSLAIKQLLQGGELVAIVPRSFCNGPYYQPFRELIIRETAIKHIHIFDSRNAAFSDDEVLQENIIIHLVKGEPQGVVAITSSPSADFHLHEESGTITASDMTTRQVPFESIVYPQDRQCFFHIAANNRDLAIINKLAVFTSRLGELGITVSTGPVVDFRMKDDLRQYIDDDSVPLLYPMHLGLEVNWPKDAKKPNAIAVSNKTRSSLWAHEGSFVITRRFSSKEERRRIVATLYESHLPGDLIGFDNGLNVFHIKKVGIESSVAKGLFVYLNCTLLDKYYRMFGGHTQVNATDLRNINYPNVESLQRIGRNVESADLSQKQIDDLIEEEIYHMSGHIADPLIAQQKIDEALNILVLLGLPRAQQNERSALTLLALLNLKPDGGWGNIERPLMGVTPIMDWCRDVYGKEYAPNTRETFRRQTLHQFVDGGLCLYNPDQPDRAVNSPHACYQIASEVYDVLSRFATEDWEKQVSQWLSVSKTLTEQYAMGREMALIPLVLNGKTEIRLSPGAHSQLIHDIVTEFGPRFAPGSEVIYLGDTGAKEDFFEKNRLAELGVTVDRKGKLPDVVLYWPERNWLLLIESVTSHGPVDGKRHSELAKLFKESTPGLVYVTAFPDRKTMVKYLPVISWETEVWVADAPTHMIHFNGDRFLGPH